MAKSLGFGSEACYYNLCLKMYEPGLTEQWSRENWYWSIGDSDVF